MFALSKLSAGAAFVPSAATSTKLTNSPVVTVNGNRYRGNNYVLDGAMNSNSNNSGEPAIVPSLESIEEVQVQTNNFSSEFGRGNGAVINLRTKTGTNQFHGRLWEFHRNAALNARNFFATTNPPLVFNQFGGNLGGPIFKDKTFFFGNYEVTRNAAGRAAAWRGAGGAEAALDRNIQLQISFAVSMANGCRYCTLHQVLGLRRIGVDPAKLLAMKKDDAVLTPREKLAVAFARKLTRDVTSVTDAYYAALKAEFQERGALEALLQTCNFA